MTTPLDILLSELEELSKRADLDEVINCGGRKVIGGPPFLIHENDKHGHLVAKLDPSVAFSYGKMTCGLHADLIVKSVNALPTLLKVIRELRVACEDIDSTLHRPPCEPCDNGIEGLPCTCGDYDLIEDLQSCKKISRSALERVGEMCNGR